MKELPCLIVDTNVLVSAFASPDGASRHVLRQVLQRKVLPLVSIPLFLEYEDVLMREATLARSPLSGAEQERLLDAFLACTRLVEVYYRWRPNLKDEGDNHVWELAVAGNAPVVTWNVRDFRQADLQANGVRILTPAAFLQEIAA